MATDYTARKHAKKFRKSERKRDEESGPKRIRKKKQARRLCRGTCFQPPTLTSDDLNDATVPAQIDPAAIFTFDNATDGLAAAKTRTPAKRAKPSPSPTDKTSEPRAKPAKRPKLSTTVNLLKPATPSTASDPVAVDVTDGATDAVPESLKDLPPLFQEYLTSEGFTTPTAVQQAAWPALLTGRDLAAVAQPGSGKTLAYVLPAMQHLVQGGHSGDTKPPGPVVLVLTPTRELAQQVAAVCRGLRRAAGGCRTVCFTGGADKSTQVAWLLKGPHVVVATPGRLLDLIDGGHLLLGSVQFAVLDEADKMLSMGFAPQIDRIKDLLLPPSTADDTNDDHTMAAEPMGRPQIAFLTATMPAPVRKVTKTWLLDPVTIDLSTGEGDGDGQPAMQSISPTITQVVHVCAEHKKPAKLLKHLESIKAASAGQRHQPKIIIFANRIKTVRFVFTHVQGAGFRTAQLHGERSQEERDAVVRDFKSGKVQVVVASDLASRGLHIGNLSYVVNYDFPGNLETYVHRVGRTGRLAADGHAYSFLTREMAPLVQPLIDLLQAHNQGVDPNLLKLAAAYATAVERLGLTPDAAAAKAKKQLDSGANGDAEADEEGEDDVAGEGEVEVAKPRTADVLRELGLKARGAKNKKRTQLPSTAADVHEPDSEGEREKPAVKSKATPAPIEKKEMEFIPARKFAGAKAGYVFKKGYAGVGYYPDVNILTLYRQKKAEEKREGGKGGGKPLALPVGGLEAGSGGAGGKGKGRGASKPLPGRLRKKLAKQRGAV